MLTKMNDLPVNVAGFVATAEVDKDDYEKTLIPALEQLKKSHGHLHLLMVMETPAKNFTLGAWLQDAWMGLKHFTDWKRVAIVTSETALESFSDKFTHFLPGKTKGFKLAELDEAKKWVAEEDD